MPTVHNRLQPITRLDFYSEKAVVHAVAACTWQRAWRSSIAHRAPQSLRKCFRDSMRVRALMAVEAVRVERVRRAESAA